jgi:hypothetical protein
MNSTACAEGSQLLRCWVSSPYKNVVLMREEMDSKERNETVDDQEEET